ncbi:branched-chain amino acid ABC transporter permease [Kaistia dalseonensis]|uniref:Branched-chain amino acid transport system permease protein n=1 Tax=Kaistia dalseonensis TaxID=410840 RepID=A0ABU0H735_9HYPH|nr:branched-chain amino acid ABC transporter permease [Kaistia dalseonensis]MCX5495536.1 branched-chain amino acid ABC transporter permease [Kaistia dalseonensis]MDQ0438128.1 branched-chain amino acid transport system permease protein [Kaistia dalseonensis]
MDGTIALMLVQDGVTTGAIYALLALAIVLVFTVTRIIFVPQGEFISFGALTLSQLQQGTAPSIVWLLVGFGGLAAIFELVEALRHRRFSAVPRILGWNVGLPVLLAFLAIWLAPLKLGLGVEIVLSLALVAPLGPYLYRIVFQPLAESSVLVLLIAAMAVHVALTGFGLLFFGAEGSRTEAFSDAMFNVGPAMITGQSIAVVAVSFVLMLGLYLIFERTMIGKALRATAVNRLGARLVGISTSLSGRTVFLIAALLGGLSGILIGPLTTVYYDTGFLIGLKGFVAAIIGGLISYPIAAVAAILIGILESISSFWASAFKEVIVFTAIIPFLIWRSLRAGPAEDEE